MRKLPLALALSLLMATATTPAWAQADTIEETTTMTQETVISVDPDAFDTVQDPLTYSMQDDRIAAVTYLDDAMTLIALAETHLRSQHAELGRAALMGASGKLTNAYLINFRDHEFSRDIGPLATNIGEAVNVMDQDPERAVGILSSLLPQVASLYETQVAQMGGGAGMAPEDLDHLDEIESETEIIDTDD